MKTKITLTNNFHNTTCNVIVDGTADEYDYRLSPSQVRRIKRTLCGIDGCACGGVRSDDWLLNDCPWQAATLERK